MRRRGITVIVGAVLLALLSWQAAEVQVPYVELGPGPTVDTLGKSDGKSIITVTNAQTSTSAGQLRLVTVEVSPDLTLLGALRGWLMDDYAVVPRELIYPPDKTEKEVEDQNARDFQQSQTSAETAALRELGYPAEVTVTEVSPGFAAAGVLAADDVILAVDGTPVTSLAKLSQLVRAKPVGTQRQVTYRRKTETKTVTLATSKGEDGVPRLGVRVDQRQPHPFTLKIDLDRIGGPSAGLMFALGIIDLLKPEDLTGGKVIVGTGTIDDDGNVGPIGGIPQKLIAAKNVRAKVFLTPAANCEEAVANAQPGLPLAKVSTVDDALKALDDVRAGRTPALCTR
jgi:PDZ domain-containing protein